MLPPQLLLADFWLEALRQWEHAASDPGDRAQQLLDKADANIEDAARTDFLEKVDRSGRVSPYAEVSVMRRSASADAELADGCGLSVSQGLRQLHIIPVNCNPLGSGFSVSATASQNGPGTL